MAVDVNKVCDAENGRDRSMDLNYLEQYYHEHLNDACFSDISLGVSCPISSPFRVLISAKRCGLALLFDSTPSSFLCWLRRDSEGCFFGGEKAGKPHSFILFYLR